MRFAARLVGLTGLLVAAACRDSVVAGLRACADTTTVVTPADTTVAVGQHFVAKAQSYTCGKSQPIDDDFSWATLNGDIAVVHQTTKVVDAVAPGTTRINAVPFRSPQIGVMTVTVR
jgi:hypothetical protein